MTIPPDPIPIEPEPNQPIPFPEPEPVIGCGGMRLSRGLLTIHRPGREHT